jgi:signal transduction histidine kinase
VSLPVRAEMAIAFAVGALWFAFTTFAVADPWPNSPIITSAIAIVDLVVVVAIARYADIPYAVTVGVSSVVALDWYFIPPTHSTSLPDANNLMALLAYLLMASLLGELAVQSRRRGLLSERARGELVDEQAALRRVATLVARETPRHRVFAAITEELGRLLDVDIATMLRYEADRTVTVVAVWSGSGHQIPVNTRVSIDGDNVAAMVLDRAGPARIDSFENAAGPLSVTLRQMGIRSSAGSPIVVAGRMWGVMVASSRSIEPIAPGTETRLEQFTELAATAVANSQSRSELTASRARIVTAADDARRRIERDLHDGLQQQLVSLALQLRLAATDVASDGVDVGPFSAIQDGLVAAIDDLRELSQGIHPAILTEGGLRPALATLRRRSSVPVTLDITGPSRLPEPLEVALYYVVSEFLTNTAKHANATAVTVKVETDESFVRLSFGDDGIGGADPQRGSGLVGLQDRVHALGGSLDIVSRAGLGTEARAVLPLVTPSR